MSITPAPGMSFPEPDPETPSTTPAPAAGGQTQPVSYPTQPAPPQYANYPPPPQYPPQYAQPPQAPYGYAQPPAPSAPRSWFPIVAGVALAMLAITAGFLYSEISQIRQSLEKQVVLLSDRNATLERRITAAEARQGVIHGELQATRSTLGSAQRELNRTRAVAETLTEEQQRALQQIGQVGQQVTTLRDEAGAKLGAISGEVSTARNDIAATRKDLESTKTQLTSAIGDISKANVLIARNHDELVELKRRGERNYLEFDLPKEKQARRIGDISLLLKKADAKRQRYTVELMVEDSRVEKKDRTVNEPVQFYMGRSRALYEIVVNRVGKDRITGYVSTPK